MAPSAYQGGSSTARTHDDESGSDRYFYRLDARGDVVALTDTSGDVVNSYAYDPYGNPLSADEAVMNPYRYASYRWDDASGFYYLWNRYYDPASGRFITKDVYPGQLDSPATMNGYAYCMGDTVNLVDENGLEPHGPGMADGYRKMRDEALLRKARMIGGVGSGLSAVGGSVLVAASPSYVTPPGAALGLCLAGASTAGLGASGYAYELTIEAGGTESEALANAFWEMDVAYRLNERFGSDQ